MSLQQGNDASAVGKTNQQVVDSPPHISVRLTFIREASTYKGCQAPWEERNFLPTLKPHTPPSGAAEVEVAVQ